MAEEKNIIRVATLAPDSTELVINENFEEGLENLQAAVGGLIEAINVRGWRDGRCITIWVNEEGKLKSLPPNFAIIRKDDDELLDIVMGDIIITSADEEGNTVGLTDEELQVLKVYFNFNEGIMINNNPNLTVNKIMFV